MKLRNKKTGEVKDILISAYGISGDVALSIMNESFSNGYEDIARYKSLDDLNANWEDYTSQELPIKDIVKAYADELYNWDFFSDSQRAYVNDEGYIVVCLRNYNWYITKEPIKSNLTAIKALFEIDWIAEYDDEDNSSVYIKGSTYWKEM